MKTFLATLPATVTPYIGSYTQVTTLGLADPTAEATYDAGNDFNSTLDSVGIGNLVFITYFAPIAEL